MVSVNFQNAKIYQSSGIVKSTTPAPFSETKNHEIKDAPSFRAAAYESPVTVRTTLTTREEKKKYNNKIKFSFFSCYFFFIWCDNI